MNSNVAKILAVVAVLLTVLLAFVGYRMTRSYAENAEQAKRQASEQAAVQAVPKVLAVVATRPLPAYKKIDKDAVALVEVAVAPTNYYTSVDQVIGKEPLTDIDGGAPITGRYFAEGNILAKAIPPGFQAVSVEVSDVIGVGGFIRPGDIVDVLLYLQSGNEVSNVQARVLLKDTRVLAYEELVVERPEGLKDEEQNGRNANNSGRRQRTAVLAVPEVDTTRLMLGASMGQLRLALHGVVKAEEGETVAVLPELQIAGGLPLSEAAQKAEADKKVPDKVITAGQLSRVELPAAQRRVISEKIYVYRASTVETVQP
jgi:pilus assembly protein CpaB